MRRALACVCAWCCVLILSHGYNLDTRSPESFRGQNGSMFGYSVLLHRHQQNPWLLVGAPTDDSSFNASIKKPGAVYKCNISNKKCEQLRTGVEHCGKTCWPESDNQWLGVSLSRRPSNGDILACGHRWKNVFFSRKDNQNKLPHGVCFKFNSDFSRTNNYIPCYRDHQRKFGENYGSCQAGISNFLTEDLMIMGAPGSWYWTGSVLVHNMSSNMLAAYVDEDNTVQFGSYLGYSVGAGHFLHPQTTEIIGGAPQNGRIGKAYIFEVEGNKLRIVNETSGAQLGSYYGASICAVDLNADGLSDLLVGAPMYSTVREEGRVYVYINQGRANMKEAEFKLVGSESYAARFGETITDLGDIDNDGYPDVAIGAPQEDDLRGAIYIYNGRKSGIASRFSQRITGSMLGGSFSMFGQSVSGGVDVDGNGYPDVAVGAFLSDSAVVLRTRPVVMVEASMMLPVSVNRSVASCAENGLPAVCVNVTVCFKVQGKRIPGQIELKYNLTADVQHKETFPPRFYFHGNGTSNVTAGRVKAKHGELTCSQHQAFMRKDVRDIFTSIHFKVQYELGEHSVVRGGSKSFTSLKPILQQREGHTNLVSNQTQFARYCVWENCSTNLQISARLVLPQSYNNVPYFALGNGKTIMLNATLVNAGDDAFLPKLHVRFPSSLHFIRVLDAEEKYVSCEIAEDNKTAIGLDCSVGNLYIPSLSKLNISFLMDVNQNSSAGDIGISINATRENYENTDLLHDNLASLTLPLRYGVGLNVHGFVSPTTFIFGNPELEPVDCYSEKFNYTFKVMNVGPSKALDTRVKIQIPQVLSPYPDRLIRITDLQTTVGQCHLKNSSLWLENDCDVKKASFIQELVFFLSKSSKRIMFCAEADKSCMNLECRFGNLDIGKEVTINLEVELNPAVLQISPGRHAIMQMYSVIEVTSPVRDANTILIKDDNVALVTLEAYYSQKPHPLVGNAIIVFSLLLGLIILAMLVVCLWKVSNSDLLSLILCIRSSSGLGGIFSAEFIHMYFKIIVY
uniref:Integrin alpha 4 n=1 Tax=Pygocentrus nattereri TaxID=42514 RepID=A0AAR2KGJ9_PYGNA